MRGSSRGLELAALAGFALLAHRAYSWVGYNPIDDGLVLAFSRRLLEGEIPHRDFTSYRPLLSALIHRPVVAVANESTILASRAFVICQFVFIAWAWTVVCLRALGLSVPLLEKLAYVCLALVLSLHDFPYRVDAGIDTGPVIAQARIDPTANDNFATYGLLQLGAGIQLLRGAIRGDRLQGPESATEPSSSRLWSHPTVHGYLQTRIRHRVR